MSNVALDIRGAAAALKAAITRRDVNVAPLYGGEPGGARIRCPLHNGGDPNFEIYDDGRWRCHSRCGCGGDVFSFIAARDLNIPAGTSLRGVHFEDAVRRAFDLLGADLQGFDCARDSSEGGKKGKPYPPPNEVSQLLAYAHELPLTSETFAIAGRARPGVGTYAMAAGLGLCTLLGVDDKNARPKWAKAWPAGKLFALYDDRGALATVHLRPDDPNQSKSKNPPKFNPRAWLMNEPMRALVRGESQQERDRARLLGYATAREDALQHGVVITEGPPAWCAWCRHPGPVGGLPGQEPSVGWLGRLPNDAPILLDFDPDLTGLKYLVSALRALSRHSDVRVSARMRWIVERREDANRSADAVALALASARKEDLRLLDPDELVDGPRVERMGFTPLSAEERAAIIGQGNAFGAKWTEALRMNEDGRVLATEGNLIEALKADERWAGVLGRDERADQITLLRAPPVEDLKRGAYPRELCDEDASYIGAWYERELGCEFKNGSIHRAVSAVASLHPFDRVKEYLERAGASWDGTPRLDAWLVTYLGAEDTPLVRACGAKWMISAVARTYQPGCKADYVLVLEGAQGVKKSTVFASLCVDSSWFTDAVPDLSREKAVAEIVTSGAWVIELGELDSVARADVSAIKAFLTRREERFRSAYGRQVRSRPRRVVFGASTNEGAYLRDQTGNRRFWPVRVTDISVEDLVRDRDQLWAEAVVRYRRGETWYLDEELERDAAAEQEARREIDPWEPVVRSYLATWREQATRSAERGERLRIEDLPTACLEKLDIGAAARSQREHRRVTAILRALGWDRVQRRDGEGPAVDGLRPRRWAWEPSIEWLSGVASPAIRLVSPAMSPALKSNDSDHVTSVTSVTASRARERLESDSFSEKSQTLKSVGEDGVTGVTLVTSGDGDAGDPDVWSTERCSAERF